MRDLVGWHDDPKRHPSASQSRVEFVPADVATTRRFGQDSRHALPRRAQLSLQTAIHLLTGLTSHLASPCPATRWNKSDAGSIPAASTLASGCRKVSAGLFVCWLSNQ